MIHQLHLKNRGCSGRGVRYRVLTPSELDHNELQAARALEKDDTMMKYEFDVGQLGMHMMIVAYTEPTQKDAKGSFKELNGEAKWTKTDPDSIETQWNQIFTTKDTVLLKAIYKREHGTSNAEIEDILSGKVDVLEE